MTIDIDIVDNHFNPDIIAVGDCPRGGTGIRSRLRACAARRGGSSPLAGTY
jgi:hypothetical protein